jgi:hypothetical protein
VPFTIIWESEGVHFRQDGKITGEDLVSCASSLCENERLPELKYKIVEFIEGADFEADADSIRRVSAVDRKGATKNPNLKVAVVATSALIVGMARMYELSAGEGMWETRIFETLDEARQWVGSLQPSVNSE